MRCFVVVYSCIYFVFVLFSSFIFFLVDYSMFRKMFSLLFPWFHQKKKQAITIFQAPV
jgi:hypothetical protein